MNDFNVDIAEQTAFDPVGSRRSKNISQLQVEWRGGQRAIDAEVRLATDSVNFPPRSSAGTKVQQFAILLNMEKRKEKFPVCSLIFFSQSNWFYSHII